MEEAKHWYAVRLRSNCEKVTRDRLIEMAIEHYIPTRIEVRQWSDRRKRVEVPLISCLGFVRGSHRELLEWANYEGLRLSPIYHKQTHGPLIVPDRQMEHFRLAVQVLDGNAILIEHLVFKPGDRVRITEGPMKGIEGELLRIKGHKRVVIQLEGLISLATAYIPPAWLERIAP